MSQAAKTTKLTKTFLQNGAGKNVIRITGSTYPYREIFKKNGGFYSNSQGVGHWDFYESSAEKLENLCEAVGITLEEGEIVPKEAKSSSRAKKSPSFETSDHGNRESLNKKVDNSYSSQFIDADGIGKQIVISSYILPLPKVGLKFRAYDESELESSPYKMTVVSVVEKNGTVLEFNATFDENEEEIVIKQFGDRFMLFNVSFFDKPFRLDFDTWEKPSIKK